MELGIHAPHDFSFGGKEWVRETCSDAGFTWAKIGGPDISLPEDEAEWARFDDAVDFITEDLGLKLVIDLRTTPTAFIEAVRRWRAEGRNGDVGDILFDLVSGAGDAVRRWGSVVKDWEFWGEYACPFVSGMGPNGLSDAYPHWLPHFYRAVKDVQPEANVWNGGYGCDMNDYFLRGLIQDGAVGSFDKCNWHHYNMTNLYRMEGGEYVYEDDLATRVAYSTDKYDELLSGAREALTEAGGTQPFVSSEWGLPVCRDLKTQLPPGLASMVFENVVPAFDSEAPAFMDAWLACFERHGFETVVIHNLRDNGPMAGTRDNLHWGQYCGLFFEDGTPKQCYETVKRWARKGRG